MASGSPPPAHPGQTSPGACGPYVLPQRRAGNAPTSVNAGGGFQSTSWRTRSAPEPGTEVNLSDPRSTNTEPYPLGFNQKCPDGMAISDMDTLDKKTLSAALNLMDKDASWEDDGDLRGVIMFMPREYRNYFNAVEIDDWVFGHPLVILNYNENTRMVDIFPMTSSGGDGPKRDKTGEPMDKQMLAISLNEHGHHTDLHMDLKGGRANLKNPSAINTKKVYTIPFRFLHGWGYNSSTRPRLTKESYYFMMVFGKRSVELEEKIAKWNLSDAHVPREVISRVKRELFATLKERLQKLRRLWNRLRSPRESKLRNKWQRLDSPQQQPTSLVVSTTLRFPLSRSPSIPDHERSDNWRRPPPSVSLEPDTMASIFLDDNTNLPPSTPTSTRPSTPSPDTPTPTILADIVSGGIDFSGQIRGIGNPSQAHSRPSRPSRPRRGINLAR
ncbi:hypothetical protein B0T20DRAFT_388223 [Sordaria brevicollis]|uniref:Uncharacterized protein n=1 Tax=Sordaria brevicollis TaxID=83679 RepID=A0AAE0PM63_SORBR|nr:hypothetical protein B0T20DRAFT_388223 [Sordaria brevicollis]